MKVTCNVIRDILPLYVEDMASEDSARIIEEHIQTCEACKKYSDVLKAPGRPLPEMDKVPVKRLQAILLQKKIRTIAAAVFAAIIIMVIIGANITVPEYFPYSEGLVALKESNDGFMYAVFSDEVSGYGVSTSTSDDESGYVYHIVAWDSIWDGKIMKNNSRNVVLNPEGEKVSAVYYYETDGSGEILIYGEQQNPCGVIIKQPKLVLMAAGAALALLACIILMVIFRKNRGISRLLQYAVPLPAAYLTAHFLVKGFSAASYSAARDFWAGMLVMLPVSCIFYACIYMIMRKKAKL